jgi:hypothetical protein
VVVELGGTTTVLCAGGGGLLLLNDRHPLSASGNSRRTRARRMRGSLQRRGRQRKVIIGLEQRYRPAPHNSVSHNSVWRSSVARRVRPIALSQPVRRVGPRPRILHAVTARPGSPVRTARRLREIARGPAAAIALTAKERVTA